MPDPIIFTSVTPHYSLPLLFPGQVQKEFYVNEAHSLLDSLIHSSVEGMATTPPLSPSEGDLWLIAAPSQDSWAGFEHYIASYQGSAWRFIEPKQGMRVFDKEQGQFWLFDTQWSAGSISGEPEGGTNIDTEARATISELVQVLKNSGILPRN